MGRHTIYFDWLTFTYTLVLGVLGTTLLLSLEPQLFWQQLSFQIIGLMLFYIFWKIDFGIYRHLFFYIYIFSVIWLLISFLGPNVRGATRWLEIGIFRIQPSELIKPFFTLFFSIWFTYFKPNKIKNFFLSLILFIIPALIIFRQPDLGNVMVYATIFLVILIVSGLPLWLFACMLITGGILLPVFYNLLQTFQKQRIAVFLNPLLDPQGAGYNAIQSIITVGSGQLFGRGFGRGTQSLLQFLPEKHTDFIFASFAEMFGLLGSITLLTIFFLLLFRILHISNKDTPIAFFYACGLFGQLLVQIVINIGMNIGLMPITGITLPLISYGGSSTIATWISLGIFFASLRTRQL